MKQRQPPHSEIREAKGSRDSVLSRRQALLPTDAVGTTKWSLESVSGLLGTRRCCGAISRGSSATDDFAVEQWSKQIPNRTTITRETGYCPRWPAAADRQPAAGEPPGPLPSATLSRSRKRALSSGLLRDPAGQEQTRIVSRQKEVIQAPLLHRHAPTLADLMLHRPFRRLTSLGHT